MTALYPVLIDLTSVPILVVGGGQVALRKVRGFLQAGGLPAVLAPDLTPELAALVASEGLEHRSTSYAEGDTRGYRIVVAATDRSEVNAHVASEARAAGAWVNVVDDPSASTLTMPAVLREGGILVSLSTGGAAPLLAHRLRARLEAVVTPGLGRTVARVHAARQKARERWPDDEVRRRSFWFSLITDEFLDAAIAGDDEEVESRIEACLSQS